MQSCKRLLIGRKRKFHNGLKACSMAVRHERNFGMAGISRSYANLVHISGTIFPPRSSDRRKHFSQRVHRQQARRWPPESGPLIAPDLCAVTRWAAESGFEAGECPGGSLRKSAKKPRTESECFVLISLLLQGEPYSLSPTTACVPFHCQTPGGMTKTLNRLEADGLIRRRTDRGRPPRRFLVELTAKGLKSVGTASGPNLARLRRRPFSPMIPPNSRT